MNSKKYLIIFLSFFIFSCQSNNVVYEASGDFITSEKEVVGSIEIMEQGSGSNLRINLTKFIPGLHYLKINNFYYLLKSLVIKNKEGKSLKYCFQKMNHV